jgi:hypothetical protein
LLLTIAGGFILYPDLFFDHPHRGLSYYGNYFPTIVPYATGLIISISSLLFAAYFLPTKPTQFAVLRFLFVAIAIGLASILATPEQAGVLFYWAHAFATVSLFIIAGGTALWMLLRHKMQFFDWLLLSLLLVGSAMSLLSAPYVAVLGVLPLGQVLALNGATVLIVRVTSAWLTQHETKNEESRTNEDVQSPAVERVTE